MILSIEFTSPEELQLLEPLLAFLKKHEVKTRLREPVVLPKTPAEKSVAERQASKRAAVERLHGALNIEGDFDYKSFIANAKFAEYEALG